MNQDFFQNQNPNGPTFFDTPVKKNAKYYRTTARARLSKIWGVAILVTLLAMLLGGVAESSGFSFNFESDFSVATESGDATTDTATALTESELNFLVAVIIFFVVVVALAAIAFELFVASPVKVGYRRFLLEVADENTPEIRVATLFNYFKKGFYLKSVRLNALHFLLSLATAIPSLAALGISVFMVAGSFTLEELAAYTLLELFNALLLPLAIIGIGSLISTVLSALVYYVYGFSFFIMADCPAAGAIEALRSSRTLMRGNKWKLFCLDFSFIGWYLLAAFFTCGIGMIFLTPYMYTARALFYSDLSHRDEAKEFTFPSIDTDEGEAADAPEAPAAPVIGEDAPTESVDTADGINPESLEEIEFPSLDLDDEGKDE